MSHKKLTIGIIGLGRFGTLAATVLGNDFNVLACDLNNEEKDVAARAAKIGIRLSSLPDVAGADIVVLATPISKTENLIKKIAPYLKDGALVMDTCSVKMLPCRWLKAGIKNKKIDIMGTHPMFGPVTSKFNLEKKTWNLAGLQIVLCPLRIGEGRLAKVKIFLEKLGLKVLEKTPAEHDKQNAYTLGLVHLLGRALVSAGAKEQEIFTPGYADLLKIIPHTASDNWQLFFDMHKLNPYAEKVRRKFYAACAGLEKKIINSNNRKNKK